MRNFILSGGDAALLLIGITVLSLIYGAAVALEYVSQWLDRDH